MDFTIKKANFYVGVNTPEGLALITKTDNIKRTWEADPEGTPKVFTKKIAEEMVLSLYLNGVMATVVYIPDYINWHHQPFIVTKD